uniref:Uncharacterized protein n=1 Tax=Panagrolaimus sp. ES5 TaxID=591445 RepID=A0AC34F2W0_9BILA
MKKFSKDRSSPSHLLSRKQKSTPNTPENQHSPRFYSPNNSAGKPRMNEIVLYEPHASLNFQTLPYEIQKRFAQLVPTPAANNFFKTSKTAASFANLRTIIDDLEIFYHSKCTYTPKIDDIKCVEILDKLVLKSIPQTSGLEPVISSLPVYFSKLAITESWIEFDILKALVEHQHVNEVIFDGDINFGETEIPSEVINAFFDRLTKIRKIRLSISLLTGNEKNTTQFLSTAKNFEKSLRTVNTYKTVIFTQKIHRRKIYDL